MNPRPTIAFDIDGVFTLNPSAWTAVFTFMRRQGFQCIIVTGADQPQEKLSRLLIPRDAVIINSGRDFKEHAALKAGYKVDVWIDDMPGVIQDCRILNTPKDEEI